MIIPWILGLQEELKGKGPWIIGLQGELQEQSPYI
jgi:hypothetical protein